MASNRGNATRWPDQSTTRPPATTARSGAPPGFASSISASAGRRNHARSTASSSCGSAARRRCSCPGRAWPIGVASRRGADRPHRRGGGSPPRSPARRPAVSSTSRNSCHGAIPNPARRFRPPAASTPPQPRRFALRTIGSSAYKVRRDRRRPRSRTTNRPTPSPMARCEQPGTIRREQRQARDRLDRPRHRHDRRGEPRARRNQRDSPAASRAPTAPASATKHQRPGGWPGAAPPPRISSPSSAIAALRRLVEARAAAGSASRTTSTRRAT